jgi:N-acetylmuramoyl-L-alanine amidase CwlA
MVVTKIQKHLTDINKGDKGTNTPEWIIFHFVGAAGQSWDNANYFKSVYRGASAHYFVDPKNIVQVVEDDTPAWHIGDGYRSGEGQFNGYHKAVGATNTNAIGIELCQDTSTGSDVWHWDFADETVDNAEWLINQLQVKYGIDDDHVIRHFDASGKLCPGNWQYDGWAKWTAFKKRLAGVPQSASTAVSVSDGKPSVTGMYLVQEGDTLAKIAKANKVTVQDLIKWNDLDNPDLIFPETKLFVKAPTVSGTTDIDALARKTINGEYGSGDARKKALGKNYDAVQKRVNEILLGTSAEVVKSTSQLVKEVLDGKHGSGDQRKESLGTRYNEVQAEVNKLLGLGGGKSVDTLAKEVLDGKWGNGVERKNRLVKAGYNFNAVQARVNQLI